MTSKLKMSLYQISRAQHLEWAKARALEYVELGQLRYALNSTVSDLRKHPETENHLAIQLGYNLWVAGHLQTSEQMRAFINKTN